jgi:hypothetical protein
MENDAEIKRDFFHLVNMTPARLEHWLATDESREVGWDSGDGESVGHKSGKRIIQIKRKRRADLTPADYKHMRKVVGYIRRHLAQRPRKVAESPWRYSLMNWGHDPLKKKAG